MPRRFSRSKTIVFAAVPGVVLLLVLLAVAEVVLRVKYDAVEQITGVADWKVGAFGDLTYHWDRYHPSYGWTNIPGYRSDDSVPFQVTINGQGLRASRDYAPRPPEGTRRIAVLGDSCTFGEEVDDDETLPFFLERFLADSEVLNFGVHGFGLGQMTLRLEQEVFDFHPHHVLLVLTLPSDLGRTNNAEFVHAKPVFTVKDGRLRIENHPVPLASAQPWAVQHSYAAAWLLGRPRPFQVSDSWDDVWQVTRLLIERVRRQCAEREIGLTVVSIAGPTWVQSLDSHPTVRKLLGGSRRVINGLDVDVSDQIGFLGELLLTGTDLVSPTTAHWSGRGNCLLAQNLARDLAARFPSWALAGEAPGCKGPGYD